MGKKTYRIQEIGEVVGGGTPSTKIAAYWDGDIAWISPADLSNYHNVYIERGKNNITQLGLKKSSTVLLPPNSVLLTSRAPIGYIALAKNSICTNQGFKSIVCNSKIVDYKYLYYYLRQSIDYIKLFASGSTFPELSGNRLKRIKITIEQDVLVQKKIASILSAYDELIENNNKRIKILEQMAENLYKEWFVRFRFPGYETAEFIEKYPSGWKVCKKEKNMIPTVFKYGFLQEIGRFIRGTNITSFEMKEGAIPVISAGIEPSGYHEVSNVKGVSLTISASGANAGYLKYNLDDIWAADCSYYQNDDNIWFVYNTLKFLQPIIMNMQCGAAQPHVYPKDINKLSILLPTKEIMMQFNKKASCIYKEIAIIKKQNQNLIKQRDLLLPRLMSGKLEI